MAFFRILMFVCIVIGIEFAMLRYVFFKKSIGLRASAIVLSLIPLGICSIALILLKFTSLLMPFNSDNQLLGFAILAIIVSLLIGMVALPFIYKKKLVVPNVKGENRGYENSLHEIVSEALPETPAKDDINILTIDTEAVVPRAAVIENDFVVEPVQETVQERKDPTTQNKPTKSAVKEFQPINKRMYSLGKNQIVALTILIFLAIVYFYNFIIMAFY